jgi:menaquinone-dependent protoporphyrinogen oxidase
MRTLVAYVSKYGTTRNCAEKIAARLPGETELVDLKRERVKSLAGFDAVIIGGAIYAGKIMRSVRSFCERNRDGLLDRTVGLFVCCLYTGETARTELEEAFPPWLNAHAVIRRPVGGAIHYAELGFLDRYLARKVACITEDIDTVKDEELSLIAETTGGYLMSSTSSPKTSGR